MTLRRLLFVVLLLACGAPASAQWSASLNTEHRYDDNSFSMRDRRADVYHQLFGSAAYDRSGDYSFTQFYWYGAIVLFRTYADRTYTQHTVGVYHQIQLDHRESDDDDEEAVLKDTDAADDTDDADAVDEDSVDVDEDAGDDDGTVADADEEEAVDEAAEQDEDTNAEAVPVVAPQTGAMAELPASTLPGDSLVSYLILKPSVGGRLDHDAWNFYDFRTAAMGGMLRWHLAGPVMTRTQYEVRYKEYPHLVQFTHVEHGVALTLSSRLGAGAECFVSFEGGIKSYTETVNDTTWDVGGNGGKGKGGVKPKKAIVSRFSTPSASQLVVSGGVSLALARGSQLTVSALRRTNPSNEARYADFRIFSSAATEDEVFDDRYGYQATELLAQWTQGIGAVTASVQFSFGARQYARAAFSEVGEVLAGEPQRRDLRSDVVAGVTYPVLASGGGPFALSIGMELRIVRNQSNDAYHDYVIHQAGLTLDLAF